MSIVGKLGGIEGKQRITDVLENGTGSSSTNKLGEFTFVGELGPFISENTVERQLQGPTYVKIASNITPSDDSDPIIFEATSYRILNGEAYDILASGLVIIIDEDDDNRLRVMTMGEGGDYINAEVIGITEEDGSYDAFVANDTTAIVFIGQIEEVEGTISGPLIFKEGTVEIVGNVI